MAWSWNKDPKEQRLRQLNSMMHIFGKSNSILAGHTITCRVVHQPAIKAPAWTEGRKISFNDGDLGDVKTVEDIVRLTGLNNHEFGHATLTPDVRHAQDNFGAFIRGGHSEVQMAFNILEDQRTESMNVALYPPMLHYLTAVFVEYIMSSREVDDQGNPKTPDHSTTFILSHGRRFLGSGIRDAIKDKFIMPELIPDIEDVIDRYRVLNLFKLDDRRRAKVLIERFVDLINRLPQDKASEVRSYRHAEIAGGEGQGDGGMENSGEGEKLTAVASQGVQNGDDDRDNREEGQSGGGDDKDSEGDDSDGESGEGDGKDSDDDSWGKGESASGGGAGRGRGTSKGKRNAAEADHGSEDLNTAVRDALNAILKDQDVSSDIRKVRDAMRGGDPSEKIEEKVSFRDHHDQEAVGLARRMGRKFQEIVEQQDPGWVRRTPTGRLNAQRAMMGADPEEAFDAWDEGNADAGSVELAVIVDTSGSMTGHAGELSKAVWAIKTAADAMGAPCTVYAYSDGAQVIYSATDKAHGGKLPALYASGGTNANQAVREATRRLMESKRKKRVFIAMTDGQWFDGYTRQSGSRTSDEYIQAMTDSGIVTAMAFYALDRDRAGLMADPSRIPSHNCGIVRVIEDMDSLVDLTNGIVRAAIRQRG